MTSPNTVKEPDESQSTQIPGKPIKGTCVCVLLKHTLTIKRCDATVQIFGATSTVSCLVITVMCGEH